MPASIPLVRALDLESLDYLFNIVTQLLVLCDIRVDDFGVRPRTSRVVE